MTSATANRTTELLDGLRNVVNLHEFAELFGFNWHDESDWTWHDVAVKMADELEQAIAATLGRGAERDARCLGCKYQLDGMCMLPVGDDYRREFVDDDYFCASWGNIRASWDGLRKFWCIELTDEGVRMRDAHDEALRRIAALEELVWFMVPFFGSACSHECGCPDDYFEPHGCDDGCKALKELNERMKELGIEVD